MLSVKAREASDTVFKVFGMTELEIKPSLPCFADGHFSHKATKVQHNAQFCVVHFDFVFDILL